MSSSDLPRKRRGCFTATRDLIHSPSTEVQINGLKGKAAPAAWRGHTRSWRKTLKPESSGPGAPDGAERPPKPDKTEFAFPLLPAEQPLDGDLNSMRFGDAPLSS